MNILRKGTVFGQEKQCDMKSFCVVWLTVFFCDELDIKEIFLEDKTDLCRDTEIGRCSQNNFLEHGVFGKLVGVLDLGV